MNGQESQDTTATTVPTEPEGQSSTNGESAIPAFPATVGPCPLCRQIVARAYGDHPEQPFWFHLAPRAGPCLRHRGGPKAWQ